VLFFFYLLGSFPVYIDPVRIGALALIRHLDVFPAFIWAATGIIWFIVAMLLRAVVMRWVELMAVISTATTAIVQLGCPALMMGRLVLMGSAPRIHWAGIVICILLAVALIAYAFVRLPAALGF
jgi:hypothetical protein